MSSHSKATRFHPLGAPTRGAGVIVEDEHDPYAETSSPPEPTVCPECRAVFHAGRWQWLDSPAGAHEHLCPACRRTRDRFPAGFLTLEGDFLREHRDEVMALVRHRAERARSEHPLQRLMAMEVRDPAVLVTTTDTHLARNLATALHDAYRGELKFHYEKGQALLRVHWQR